MKQVMSARIFQRAHMRTLHGQLRTNKRNLFHRAVAYNSAIAKTGESHVQTNHCHTNFDRMTDKKFELSYSPSTTFELFFTIPQWNIIFSFELFLVFWDQENISLLRKLVCVRKRLNWDKGIFPALLKRVLIWIIFFLGVLSFCTIIGVLLAAVTIFLSF